ncbi:MAG: secretion protein HlyD [Acidobacteriales bacterium]|nr:secretion protein HlyD [Terriglobales bacterium]
MANTVNEIEAPEQDRVRAGELPPERPRGKRNLKPLMFAGGLLAVIVVVGWWWYSAGRESTDDAQIDGHIYSISARITGHVVKVNVDDNQLVKAGDVVAEIDPSDYQVTLQRLEAELADAKANAESARTGLPITSATTSSQVESARADVENNQAGLQASQQQYQASAARLREAEANNVKAQADLNRYKQLVQKDEISKQQYDQSVAAAQASAATVEAAQAALSAAQQQIAQSRGKITQAQATLRTANTAPQQVQNSRAKLSAAEAQVQKAQANLDQAKLNLQYTKIVAPVNGIVGRKTVEAGQNVQPGQQLMSLVSLDDVWVTANYKETQLKKMRVGQEAHIEVDAYGREYKGHIESIGGASGARFSLLPPENATGNYVKVVQRIPVKIVFEQGENSDRALRPGMSVTATVLLREKK